MGYVIFQENEAPPHPPKPGTFRVLNPHHVDAYQAEDGWVGRRIGGEVDTDRDGYFTLGSTRYRLLELNNPLFSPNEQGISPGVLESFPQTFEVIKAQREFARGSFRSGIPSGYLKSSNPQLSDQAARRMQEQWMLAHGGEDHRSVAVLNATTSFTPIALTAVDSALVDMSRLSTLDVALMFGVPPNMLGVAVSESLTYQTAETRTLDLRTYSLTPWATVIEETLSALLPQGQRVSISFQGMMRADMATRVRYYEAGQSGGWLTVNEIRAAENLPQFAIAPESEPEQTDQSEGEQDAEDQLQ
jgi:HK97 family phage portal protein